MICKLAVVFIINILLLVAQNSTWERATVENLKVDKITSAPSNIVQEIENKGLKYWIQPSNEIAHSKDGSYIAELRREQSTNTCVGVWLIDTETHVEKVITKNITKYLEWAPSDRFLAYVQYELTDDPQLEKLKYKPAFNSERLCIFDRQTGQSKSIAFMNGLGMRLQWSSAKDYIAYCYVDETKEKYMLMVYDATNDEHYTIDEIIPMATWNFDWSPNGEIIVYTKPLRYDVYVNEEQPLEADIFISNYDGSEIRQLTHTPEPEVRVKCLHDSREIVTEIIQNVESVDYRIEYKSLILKKEGSKWLK